MLVTDMTPRAREIAGGSFVASRKAKLIELLESVGAGGIRSHYGSRPDALLIGLSAHRCDGLRG